MIIDSIASLTETPSPTRSRTQRARLHAAVGAVAAVGVLLLGMRVLQPQDADAPVSPVAVDALADDGPTAVTGRVAEIFGNKFILVDPSGRALIETGRAGEHGQLVAGDETVTVQGRFRHGFLHAEKLVHADGRVDELHAPPPHHGPHHGPHHRPHHGPDPVGPGAMAVAPQR